MEAFVEHQKYKLKSQTSKNYLLVIAKVSVYMT